MTSVKTRISRLVILQENIYISVTGKSLLGADHLEEKRKKDTQRTSFLFTPTMLY